MQKIVTNMMIFMGFFFPKKTAAKASHPLELEIFGTKAPILIVSKQPANEAYIPAIIHPNILGKSGFTPLESKTSESVPLMRI